MARQIRFQFVLPEWLLSVTRELAKAKGVSVAEYLKDIIKSHVEAIEEGRHDERLKPFKDAKKALGEEAAKKIEKATEKREKEDRALAREVSEAILAKMRERDNQ